MPHSLPRRVGYWSTDGIGLLEYLRMAEDIGAEPLLAVFAGYTLNGQHVPQEEFGPFIQDALGEIEYVIGDVSTPWGARRAADGHPAPFPLSYVEVGNEDWFDTSGSYAWRFTEMYDAIKARYPDGVSRIDGTGTRTVLTGNPATRNTLDQPGAVLPVTEQITGLDLSTRLSIPANSVTVLRVTGQ